MYFLENNHIDFKISPESGISRLQIGKNRVFNFKIQETQIMVLQRKTTKGKLLKGVLEHIPAESFEVIADGIEKTMKGKPGIYALYKKDRLYYVGLAKSVRGRIKKHRENKHRRQWDNFSVFILSKTKFLKDVETIVLGIADPPGNSVKGKIPRMRDLQNILKSEARQKARELKRLNKALQKKKPIKKRKKKSRK